MAGLSPQQHRRGAAAAERDPDVTDRAIRRAASIRELGNEPVLTLAELAVRTGAPARYLRELTQRGRDPYTTIERHRPNGKTRFLSSPEPMLMDIQRWILDHMLVAAPTHRCSWAYRPGRSVAGCANEHVSARWLVKLDIHDFFGHVDEVAVYRVFRSLRYPALLSFELARLCTRSPLTAEHGLRRDRFPYPRLPPGVLPQGAPTSGALANAVMVRVDDRLDKLAEQAGLTYTRYSDDMVLSTRGAFSRSQASEVIARVGAILGEHRFALHARKTTVVTPGARKIVLGLLLAEDRVLLAPWFRRRIEAHIRGVRLFGLPQHAAHRRFRSTLLMVEHVYGCIAFAQDVEPDRGARFLADWEAALRANGYPAGPKP